MRGFINSQFQWVNRQTSHVDLHKPVDAVRSNDDDSTHHEIATSSQMF
jgi:hypothetical protein